MRRPSVAALLAAAMALSGCNLVISPTPAPVSSKGPMLKPGYWTSLGCNADLVRAKNANCPLGVVVDERTLRVETDGTGGQMFEAATANPWDYRMVAGGPLMLQLASGEGGPGAVFLFAGVEPLARDTDGRLLEARFWPVLCGPPRAKEPEWPKGYVTSEGVMVTPTPPPADKLFPGLKSNGDTTDKPGCSFKTVKALRNAASASKGLDRDLVLHWEGEAPR